MKNEGPENPENKIVKQILVDLTDKNSIRLDKYLAEELQLMSRSQLKSRNVKAFLDDKAVRLSRVVKGGEKIILSYDKQHQINLKPEKMDLRILYEDENVLVVNKQQGLVVHPGAGNYTGTLVHGLLYHYQNLKENFPKQDFRPGIVHRLDKDTSGVIICALNSQSQEFLSRQFAGRKVGKTYLAIVKGRPPQNKGIIKTLFGRDPKNRKLFSCLVNKGKKAITRYRVLRSWDKYSCLLLQPKTGRTHQLRVHMKYISCPILGDPLYGRKNTDLGELSLMLHSWHLEIALPEKEKILSVRSPLPARFKRLFDQLNSI